MQAATNNPEAAEKYEHMANQARQGSILAKSPAQAAWAASSTVGPAPSSPTPLRDLLSIQDSTLDSLFAMIDQVEAQLQLVMSEPIPSRDMQSGLTACTNAGNMAVQTIQRINYATERLRVIADRIHV